MSNFPQHEIPYFQRLVDLLLSESVHQTTHVYIWLSHGNMFYIPQNPNEIFSSKMRAERTLKYPECGLQAFSFTCDTGPLFYFRLLSDFKSRRSPWWSVPLLPPTYHGSKHLLQKPK
ncbi:unnamed protein product, partial [Scytosiphon promiscuus]